jgi:excisionase family DNA binding protein
MLLNKRETTQRLRISLSTLDRHIAHGVLIPVKIGGRVLFREESLERFIRDCEQKARHRARERSLTT